MKNKIIKLLQKHIHIRLDLSFIMSIFAFFILTIFPTEQLYADGQEKKLTVRGSGYPVPRFVTLKFDKTNMRAGPGREYPVLWQYQVVGLPLRVDAEFGIWRKVVDHDGAAGWIHGPALSLQRMALVQTNMTKIHASPDKSSIVIALAERNALLVLQSCPKKWCKIAFESGSGWILREKIWGLLKTESLD